MRALAAVGRNCRQVDLLWFLAWNEECLMNVVNRHQEAVYLARGITGGDPWVDLRPHLHRSRSSILFAECISGLLSKSDVENSASYRAETLPVTAALNENIARRRIFWERPNPAFIH